MQTLKSCLWRQIAGLMPIYRRTRQNTVKRVIAPLRTELLSDHLLRDLGLPTLDVRGREADVRLPRL
jgi:hypothetical protein